MSYEAEASVLGALIKQPDLMDDCYLKPEEFIADDRHALILETLQYCYEIEGTVDLVMLVQRAGSNVMKIGGMSYLSELAASVPTANNFMSYQYIVRETFINREASASFASYAGSERIDLSKAAAKIEELQEMQKRPGSSGGLKKMGGVLNGHEEVIEERQKKRGMTGARTISKKLDAITGGHQRQELEIVAARPSVGKTAYMNGDALQAAKDGYAAAIFSGEMPELQVTERMICTMANIDHSKLRSGSFDDDDWLKYSFARDELDQLPIFIDDEPGMTIQHIRREVKKLVKDQPNLIVYIDYIQLIGGGRKFKDKREEVEYVSKSLKLLARECDITIVALAQLSRGVEQRQDKRPMLSDIKEAGGIEQDADIITFLHREDYYDKNTEKKNIIELIIAKGRNVGTFTIEMAFLKQYGKFVDLERSAA
ncbi:replicative DNA helicase [Paenibacillus sp. MMO-58]|uniref:replicative DNA helicase n=1 Tax=Paenibacillus sp. MMO-58 TaxID=3081290 RepID=UPI0030184A2C